MHKLGVESTARASFYFYNTKTEVDRFVEVVKEIQKFFGQLNSRYQEWLKYVFDHEVADKLPQWHYAEDAPVFETSDDEMTETN